VRRGIGNREQGTGNRGKKARGKRQKKGTGNREQGTGGRRQGERVDWGFKMVYLLGKLSLC
jgi:hypothetical protein